MIRILIADDHPIVRRGLRQILSDRFEGVHLGEAENSQQALELIQKEDWDMAILDVSMPGRGGLELLKELKRGHPGLPVLILSIHPEDQYAIRSLKAGAAGYLTKGSVPEELVKAVEKILAGGKYVSSTLAEKLAYTLAGGTKEHPHEALSDREYQVMVMIASGKTVSEIADELSLSVKTISTYQTRILEKMGMKNNAELMHYAMENKLVE